jgi:hypothetical protein
MALRIGGAHDSRPAHLTTKRAWASAGPWGIRWAFGPYDNTLPGRPAAPYRRHPAQPLRSFIPNGCAGVALARQITAVGAGSVARLIGRDRHIAQRGARCTWLRDLSCIMVAASHHGAPIEAAYGGHANLISEGGHIG